MPSDSWSFFETHREKPGQIQESTRRTFALFSVAIHLGPRSVLMIPSCVLLNMHEDLIYWFFECNPATWRFNLGSALALWNPGMCCILKPFHCVSAPAWTDLPASLAMMPSECCLQKVEDLRPLDSRPVNLRWLKLIILKIQKIWHQFMWSFLDSDFPHTVKRIGTKMNQHIHQPIQHLSYQTYHPCHQIKLHISYHMTVGRKACSQNRPNNAFPCVTPLLVNKKHTCLTIIKFASKNTNASIFFPQRTCADFFQSDESEVNYCYGTWHRSLLSFAFPSLQCVVGLFSSVVWTNSSGILRAFFPRKWSSVLGSPPYFTQMHFFACAGLARSLREKCNLISQFWSCWIDIFWNRCSLKTNSIFKEKLWW